MPQPLTLEGEGVGEATGLQPQRGERRAGLQEQGQGPAAGVAQRVQAQVQLLQALPGWVAADERFRGQSDLFRGQRSGLGDKEAI